MADQGAAAGAVDGLEGKLRTMILGNATSASPDDRQASGRGARGRGNRGRAERRQHGPRRAQAAQNQLQPDEQHGHDRQKVVHNQIQPAQRGGASRQQNNVSRPQPSQSQPRQMQLLSQPANNNRSQSEQQNSTPPRRGPWAGSQPSHFAPLQNPQLPPVAVANAQSTFLEHLATRMLPDLQMKPLDLHTKDEFRIRLESVCRTVACTAVHDDQLKLDLVPFGSISSGFAMPGSDMDLALMISEEVPGLFRMLEKAFLDEGIGAHLLVKTRVPILKLCELPPVDLLQALRDERQKWDDMSPAERERNDSSGPRDIESVEGTKAEGQGSDAKKGSLHPPNTVDAADVNREAVDPGADQMKGGAKQADTNGEAKISIADRGSAVDAAKPTAQPDTNRPSPVRQPRAWYREKRLGPLDFPKDGVGVQCDINTANPLGIHNTLLLRCYSHCDPRVQYMVLFVKAWASKRLINSSRNGTLSSYGYVLMVLHFLVNIATPAVCPNLQLARQSQYAPDPGNSNAFCEGRDVRFWRNEAEIHSLAGKGFLTHNREPLGVLLRNFFAYYTERNGFSWTQDVLSLRTPGGIVSKQAKGWTGARTTMQNKLEVRNRYLFAIEDPFETDHNVARTVTHNGVVAIRDEFRRAWRILQAVGRNQKPEGDLFEPSDSRQPPLPDKKHQSGAAEMPIGDGAHEDIQAAGGQMS